MKINPNNLEVKYVLNVYQEMEGFPSYKDKIYELIKSLEELSLENSTFKPEQLLPRVKNIFSGLKDLRKFLIEISNKNEYPEHFFESVEKDSFVLTNNPWS